MSHQGTLQGIVDGLTTVLERIRDEHDAKIQVVGWTGQTAHVPPSAWITVGTSTTHPTDGGAGRIEDRIPFSLWLTLPSANDNDADRRALVTLADAAVPIVDAACARKAAGDVFGIERIARNGFRFTDATSAPDSGSPPQIPALEIPVVARWAATYC